MREKQEGSIRHTHWRQYQFYCPHFIIFEGNVCQYLHIEVHVFVLQLVTSDVMIMPCCFKAVSLMRLDVLVCFLPVV